MQANQDNLTLLSKQLNNLSAIFFNFVCNITLLIHWSHGVFIYAVLIQKDTTDWVICTEQKLIWLTILETGRSKIKGAMGSEVFLTAGKKHHISERGKWPKTTL